MSDTLIKGDNLEELKKLNLDLNDITVLDSLSLDKKSSQIGLIKSVFFYCNCHIRILYTFNHKWNDRCSFWFYLQFLYKGFRKFWTMVNNLSYSIYWSCERIWKIFC